MTHWSKRHRVVLAVYVLLRQPDGTVLFIRRANTGYMDGYYSLPSGHVDGGEPAHLAAIREAWEEVGVRIDPQDLKMIHVVHRLAEEGDHERVDIGFEATVWQGEPNNCEPGKCDELRWFDPSNLPENTIPVLREIITHIANTRPYSTHNFS